MVPSRGSAETATPEGRVQPPPTVEIGTFEALPHSTRDGARPALTDSYTAKNRQFPY
ncbi:hypothetical protein I79_026190 [Cricetulus griseus]|uniref:Uncharacterized protein n=1 Tax=Cricetulus griseus TaxID=10029 RepID=G3IQ89_CRIGR|nr:hypothetical protein I79_026190 [Cricetulus griseus]